MSELVKECHHGRLTRQCRECDMEKEICELQDQLTTIIKQRDELADALANMVRVVENRPDSHYIEVFERSELEDAQNLLSTIKEQKDAQSE